MCFEQTAQVRQQVYATDLLMLNSLQQQPPPAKSKHENTTHCPLKYACSAVHGAYQVVPGGRSVGTWQVKTDAPPAPAVEVQTTAGTTVSISLPVPWCVAGL
jgi:hypothetical protein